MFLEGLCRRQGQPSWRDRGRPGVGCDFLLSSDGCACKEWETTVLSSGITSSQTTNGWSQDYASHIFFLLSTSHVGNLISPKMDQNPLEHGLILILLVLLSGLSLLSTQCLPKTDIPAADKPQLSKPETLLGLHFVIFVEDR